MSQNIEEMPKMPITISRDGALIGFKETKPRRFSNSGIMYYSTPRAKRLTSANSRSASMDLTVSN